jgi:hypothetical protein
MKDMHRFLFLCGLHRSGTSPLFKILREHPRISGFRDTGVMEDEGQHLQTIYAPASVYGGPGKFGFSRRAHLTEGSKLVTPGNRELLFQQWSKHWDLGKPWLLEKSPPNLIRTRFLQALFPDSYFVVITRHPIAVTLATWKWAKSSLELLVRHWLECHRIFERDRTHLRHVLILRYEDLIAETEPTLARVYKFIGLSPVPCSPLNRSGNDRYFELWRKLKTDHKLASVAHHIIKRYEKQLNAFGYSLVDYESAQSTPRFVES